MLHRWTSLIDEPARWRALPEDERRAVGEHLRDLFFVLEEGDQGDDEVTLARALADAISPEPTGVAEGLAASFFPAGRFRAVRFVEERRVEPPGAQALFARPVAGERQLLGVFVDPRELSFRSFENIIPLDRYFERRPLELSLTGGERLGAGACWSFAVGADDGTREALRGLDGLGLYVPPLNASSRGGERFIFHSASLADALTRAVEAAMPTAVREVGRFVHVNPVFRCNRFEPGDERFHRHLDTPYFDRSRGHVSRHTVLLYVTGGRGSPALRLGDHAIDAIAPMTCVVLDQGVAHEGSPYDDGRKVFLRTELIFEATDLVERPAIGQLFARACYLTAESVFTPALSRVADGYYNRVASAHQGGDPGDAGADVFLHKVFRGVPFVANGYDFWFPRGLPLAECAALALLDHFNAVIDGEPFRARCASAVVSPGPDPGWIDRLLAGERAGAGGEAGSAGAAGRPGAPGEGALGRLDLDALLPPPGEPDLDICCGRHFEGTTDLIRDEGMVALLRTAQAWVRERLSGAPIVLLGQQIWLDPARFVVGAGRIDVLSSRSLEPVNFAACQNASLDRDVFLGVSGVAEALRPLVPPILFAEQDGGHHLMFDFFRNSWMLDPGTAAATPLPEVIEMPAEEGEDWVAYPWQEARLRCDRAAGRRVGEPWWLDGPVWATLGGRTLDVCDPTADPATLVDLLSVADLDARVAIAANPSLPHDLLSELLTSGSMRLYIDEQRDLSPGDGKHGEEHVAAWLNPAAALAMLASPDPRHEESALGLLRWLAHLHGVRRGPPDGTLEDHIARWSTGETDDPRRARERRIVRAFARHLAGLFGLPWPEPAA